MAAKQPPDWEAIELRYRSSTESLRTIAAAHGITEGAIRLRAKKHEWTRDLKAKVREATERLLVRKTATRDIRTERDQVAVEAEMRSEVVLAHRGDVRHAKGLCVAFLRTLEAQEGGDFSEKVRNLKSLAESLRILVSLEREAFNIVNEAAGAGAVADPADVLRGLAELLPT